MAQHDREAWDHHPNREGPAGMLLGIHDSFRRGARQLRQLAERDVRSRSLVGLFTQLSHALHHHHHAEERMLFPFLEDRMGARPDVLYEEHLELIAAIDAAEAALAGRPLDEEQVRRTQASFADVLERHLAREEATAIPVLLDLTPKDAWRLFYGG